MLHFQHLKHQLFVSCVDYSGILVPRTRTRSIHFIPPTLVEAHYTYQIDNGSRQSLGTPHRDNAAGDLDGPHLQKEFDMPGEMVDRDEEEIVVEGAEDILFAECL